MSVNKFIGLGNVGKIETRFMTNGEAVTNFSVALNESWKDKNGVKQERVEWINCVAYRKLAEILQEYVKVGQQIYIEGKIQTRKWQDKEGKDRYTTEIVVNEMQMLGSKSEHQERQVETYPGGLRQEAAKPVGKQAGGFDNFADDIPFFDPYRFSWRSV